MKVTKSTNLFNFDNKSYYWRHYLHHPTTSLCATTVPQLGIIELERALVFQTNYDFRIYNFHQLAPQHILEVTLDVLTRPQS